MMDGEWVEIEPGNWYHFRPMPIPDDEVIDRHSILCAEITRLCCERVELEAQRDKVAARRHKIIGDWLVRHTIVHTDPLGRVTRSFGDGKDLLNVAPKTTATLKGIEAQLATIERVFTKLNNERAYLETWYPVTLRQFR